MPSPFDLTHQNSQIESKIVVALERISEAFRVMLWQQGKAYGLSPIQIQVLIFLNYHSEDKRRVSYLAMEFNMTKATISDTIKTLESKSLITKSYDTSDTRSYVIDLTDTGREIAARTALFTDALQQPVTLLSPQEKESMLKSLLSIISHLNQTGVITIQRMCRSCQYYQSSGPGQHYCRLLEMALREVDLRVDCPEHVMVS